MITDESKAAMMCVMDANIQALSSLRLIVSSTQHLKALSVCLSFLLPILAPRPCFTSQTLTNFTPFYQSPSSWEVRGRASCDPDFWFTLKCFLSCSENRGVTGCAKHANTMHSHRDTLALIRSEPHVRISAGTKRICPAAHVSVLINVYRPERLVWKESIYFALHVLITNHHTNWGRVIIQPIFCSTTAAFVSKQELCFLLWEMFFSWCSSGRRLSWDSNAVGNLGWQTLKAPINIHLLLG